MNNKNILIHDDNADFLQILSKFLVSEGYKVFANLDSDSILDIIEDKNIDLVIIDLILPKTSGKKIIKKIRNKNSNIPIIAVSATDEISMATDALTNGAWDFLSKPIYDLELLTIKIENALEKSSTIAQNILYKKNLEELINFRTYELKNEIERRKKIEKELISKSNQLQTVLDVGNFGFWDYDIQLNEIFYNSIFFEMLGYSATEFKADPDLWKELIHPDDYNIYVPKIEKYLMENKKFNFTFRMKCKDNSWKWINSRGFGYELDERKKVSKAICVHIDVDETKKNEIKLRRERKKYRTITDAISNYIYRLDLSVPQNPKIINIGSTVAITGYTAEEFSSQENLWLNIIHKDDRLEFIKKLQNFAPKDKILYSEYRIVCKNGSIKWISNSLIPINDNTKIKNQFDGVIKDITSEKNYSIKLKKNIEKYNAIVKNPLVGVGITDLQENLIFVNDKFAKVLNYSSDELLNKNLAEISNPESLEKMKDMTKIRLQGKSSYYYSKLLTKDNQTKELQIFSTPYKNSQGKITGSLAIILDKTEQIRNINEIKILGEKFKHTQKLEEIGKLTAKVVHDLNNILVPILSYGDILTSSVQNPKFKKYAQNVYKSGMRGKKMLSTILNRCDIAKTDIISLNLNKTINNFKDYLFYAVDKQVEIIFNLNENIKNIMADRNEIERIISNLIVNADHALTNGGKITISTYTSKSEKIKSPVEYSTLVIEDNGVGIPNDIRKKIFDPFFTTRDKEKGSGLGLSTVKEIIEKMDGNIRCESTLGFGTKFIIDFPIIKEDKSISSDKKHAKLKKGDKELILIVEDNSNVRKATSQILESLNYETILAESGLEALDKYLNSEIDLVVSDINMPNTDISDLVEKFKLENPQVKIIFMSGYEKSKFSNLKLNDSNFIEKPFTLEELSTIVNKKLNK